MNSVPARQLHRGRLPRLLHRALVATRDQRGLQRLRERRRKASMKRAADGVEEPLSPRERGFRNVFCASIATMRVALLLVVRLRGGPTTRDCSSHRDRHFHSMQKSSIPRRAARSVTTPGCHCGWPRRRQQGLQQSSTSCARRTSATSDKLSKSSRATPAGRAACSHRRRGGCGSSGARTPATPPPTPARRRPRWPRAPGRPSRCPPILC